MSAFTGHRSRPCLTSSVTFSPIRRLSMMRQVVQPLAEIEHLRPQRLAARERQQLPHQARRPVGVLLDLHDVLERRIGRLVRVEQEVGRHHDGGQHVVEVVRDAAGELADRFHAGALVDLVLQRALAGGLEHIDDGGLGVALLLLDRRDVEAAVALAAAGQARIDRRDLALPGGGLADRAFQRLAVALRHRGEDRAAVPSPFLAQRVGEHAGEQRIGARDLARPCRRWRSPSASTGRSA